MKVLVTGGAGYIGSHACKALHAAGHEPIAFDNLRTGHRWAVRWGPFEHGDIRDPIALDHVFATHQPDAVMHFAALAYVGESVQRPDIYYDTNVNGSLTLLRAMRRHRVDRFVFSSTCASYGVPEQMPITEGTPQRPINPYGRSKLMVENILEDYCSAAWIGATALRYFNAAGADNEGMTGELHEPETHLIPLVLDAAGSDNRYVSVFGTDYDTPDGTCIRDYIHVSDLAAAHVAAIERVTPGVFAAYNLGTGKGASVREVIEAARRITGRSIRVEEGPRRPGDPPVLVADPAKARAELDWTAHHTDLDAIIGSAWKWSQSLVQNGAPPG